MNTSISEYSIIVASQSLYRQAIYQLQSLLQMTLEDQKDINEKAFQSLPKGFEIVADFS